ncbi:MAG: polyphenol oxidase family protein [Planctomycetota bacterium]
MPAKAEAQGASDPGAEAIALKSFIINELGVPHAFLGRGWTDPAGVVGLGEESAPPALSAWLIDTVYPRRWAWIREPDAWVRPAAAEIQASAPRHLARARQVHGCGVWTSGVAAKGSADSAALGPEADAVVSRDPGLAVAVITADCVPVLLAGAGGGEVAAVHAGWRGLLAGVIEAAVAAVTPPITAAVGPCITAEAFEVGPEVAERFDAAVVRWPSGSGRPHVDLVAEAVRRLGAAGVDRVDHGGASHPCTYGRADRYYSYRREVSHGGAKRTGRNWSVIAPRPVG